MAVVNINSAIAIAGVGSTTLAYVSAVTAGSTLVAGGFDFNTSPGSPTISDSVNGAWTVKKYDAGAAGMSPDIEVFLATFENTAGGTPTVTWNPPGSSADLGGWFICEVTGATTPTSVDVVPLGSHSNTATPSIASGTLAQANEVIFAVMSSEFAGTQTITKDATYTELVNNGDQSVQAGEAQYKIVSSTASDTADWSYTGGAAESLAILISIKTSGGGGGVTVAQEAGIWSAMNSGGVIGRVDA